MNDIHSAKTVNFIIGHKTEIYIPDQTPTGERRVYDPDFWNEVRKLAEPNFIDLYKPFSFKIPFIQSLTNIFYHLNNILNVKKKLNKSATLTHIFFEEEAVLLKFIKLQKSAVTCLDIIPVSFPRDISLHYKWFYKFCVKGLKKASLILAISEHTKKDLIKHLKIDPSRIQVAYLGINKIFRQQQIPPEIYKKFGLSSGIKYLMTVGGLHIKRKNVKFIIEALPEILKRNPELELIICGYKTDDSNIPLLKFIESNNLKDKIHLLERVSDEDLCYLYNLAHIFVFPSLYEGFGLPIVEAMACGTPVISAHNSSLPEAGGKAAIYYPTDSKKELINAIIDLDSDQKKYKKCAEIGLKHSAKFTWKNYAKSVITAYKKFNE